MVTVEVYSETGNGHALTMTAHFAMHDDATRYAVALHEARPRCLVRILRDGKLAQTWFPRE